MWRVDPLPSRIWALQHKAYRLIVPVAFMTTFPAQALLGQLDPRLAAVSLSAAGVSFVAARAFWHFGLRFYSGASG